MQAANKLSPGDFVIINLVDECYSGNVVSITSDLRQIKLENVVENVTGNSLSGVQIFYRSQVTSIQKVRESLTKLENVTSSSELNTVEEKSAQVKLSQFEVSQIRDSIQSSVYIKQCDKAYHDAIDKLKSENFVGFSMEGVKFGRLRPASLLVFSTSSNIFIFDLVLMGRIFPELKSILQQPVPKKIIFDSRFIADYLLHEQKCSINGIVDLMVTHVVIKKIKSTITLEDCIQMYLNMRVVFPNIPDMTDLKDPAKWKKRPLSDELLHLAACNVSFLHKLYLHMIDILLKPLQDVTDEFSKTFSTNDDTVDVCHHITTNRERGISDIDENCVDGLFQLDLRKCD